MKFNSNPILKITMITFMTTLIKITKQQDKLQVSIIDKDNFCMVVPKNYKTPIGVSEQPDGTTVYCQGDQKPFDHYGSFNGKFWNQVEVTSPKEGVIQMTGCYNPDACDRLDPYDEGGQYDSNGNNGQGNPAGSYCAQYPYYVELIEPTSLRACMRCCKDGNDCNTGFDTSGCKAAIPGQYFTC